VYLTEREKRFIEGHAAMEFVVAESLYRKFQSHVLERGKIPSWRSSSAVRLEYDRGLTLDGSLVVLPESSSTNSGTILHRARSMPGGHVADKPGSIELGRIYKEYPDKYGADLAFVVKDDSAAGSSSVKYHVVRVQVKGGDSGQVITFADLKTFLAHAKVEAAKAAYARLLGVNEDQLIMHRLLVSPQ